ncbi:hypothetical protein [Streptomyces werraensis]|uniref:hypothetical protein n=1 Tax=Streptomyces werraensis TaxID=68284 RepID=UPI0037D70A99
MSGCCGQGPVIVSGAAAAPRLDVETQLMCDVLPDGTVAATVLVEPIYDTNTGARIATRITDPTTGAVYAPVGEIRVCAASPDCESPTTPVTSVGLCLADGTPIAVTITRDCTGAVTSEGWLNLATGAWSAGAVPAGTVACGDSRSIQVSGTFCDVDDAGEVVGLVLVEYTYDDTGAIASVRLVDAVTGGTYTPTGTVTVCPAGVEQPERDLIQLCDTATDGTVTPFVRDYARDENGAIVGHSDYLLDGTAYTPAGTVGVCAGTEGCRDTSTVLVCDVPDDSSTAITPTIVDSTLAAVGQTQFQTHPGPWAPLWSGGTFLYPAGAGPTQEHLGVVGQITADMAGCDGAAGTLTISVRVRNDGPAAGQAWDGALRLFRGTTAIATHNALEWAPVGWQGTLTVSAPVTAADIAAGDIRVALLLETYHLGAKAWTADQFTATLELEGCEVTTSTQFLRTLVTDCETGEVISTTDTTLDGQPYTVTGEVGQCTPASTPDDCRNCEQTVLCDVTEEGTTSFLRTVCRDCTGAVISVLDTGLDGTTPYAPVGAVGSCGPDGCPTTSVQTIRLCDLDPTVEADEDGRRCAVPFLRHLAYDCAGDLLGFHDTALDGTTPYTPVQVVDCQCESGQGLTSSIEVPWQTVSVVEDPAGLPRQDFIYTVSPENDPSRVGTIRVHVSQPAGGACGAYDINNLVFSNTAAYTLTLDAVAQEMSYLRVDLLDFDTFEPVAVNTTYPLPNRLGGTAGWNAAHTRIVPSENNGTGYMFWDNPPETVGWSVLNQGGGVSCGALSFQGMTVEPGGCCGGDESCLNCETLVLCDDGADDPAPITGTGASTGTLSNGVTWTARGSGGVQNSNYDGSAGEGSWWPGTYTFPNAVIGNHTWSFSRPAFVEFSVYMRWVDYSGGGDPQTPNPRNATLLPANVEVVSLPDGYSYDPVNHLVWVDESRGGPGNEPCTNLTAPTVAESARFRTTEPVSSVTTRYLGVRVANCGVFGSQRVGAFVVDPTGQFMRTVCRDCEGQVVSVTDTALDGQTPYTVVGTAKTCPQTIAGSVSVLGPVEVTPAEDCCQPVQVCIQQDTTQEVEFISNEGHLNDDSVDPVWKWTPDISAANPPWYDMYERQFSAAWSVVDSDTARPAWWVSPHPGGASAQSSPPRANEGPSLLNTHWFPRAFFDLPDNADPASIKVQATVFNADQIGRAFRLNSGAWQALPATATHNGTTYTFGPDTIPGAQAGRNYLYLDVEETVGGGAGLMVHLKVTYDVIPETRSWTRMVCCDGSVHYMDEDGVRQDVVPDGWHVAPCFAPSSATTNSGGVVETGVRAVTGSAVQDLVAEFPDLQSVSLAVLAGTVDVTMSDGSAVAIPAGVTLTWSVTKDTDTALAAAAFAGADSSASYLLNWTYLS